MRGLADPDSKIYALLNKAILLAELNLYVILCCLPVVTAGAALCSMHTVLLKIYRGEEKRVAGDFFRAMKSNLKNGTILWLLFLGYLGLLAGIGVSAMGRFPAGATAILCGLLLVAFFSALYLNWAMILQSRYVYTIPQCLRNALLAWLRYPGSTFLYLVSMAIPVVFCFSLKTLPLILLGGTTMPHIISTMLYSRVFDELEGIEPRLPEL